MARVTFANGDIWRLSSALIWRAKDKVTEAILNSLFGTDSIEGYDPNPEANIAERVADEFGGTASDLPDTQHEPGVVY